MQSLQRELPRLLGRGGGLHGRVNLAIYQDLAVSGLSAQSRRQIDHGTDGGIVEATLKADAPERCIALGDAHAEAQLMAELAPSLEQSSDAVAHFHRHVHGFQRGIW